MLDFSAVEDAYVEHLAVAQSGARLGSGRLLRTDAGQVERVIRCAPPSVQELVSDGGGFGALMSSLDDLDARGNAVVLALDSLANKSDDVALELDGFDDLLAAASIGPVIVVEPHLGPGAFTPLRLLRAGRPVAAFAQRRPVVLDLVEEGSLERLPLRIIRSSNVASRVIAGATLRQGYALMWQPDVRPAAVGLGDLEVQLLDTSCRASSVVGDLVASTGARVFSASVRMGQAPRLRAQYRELTFADPSPAVIVGEIYRSVDKLMRASRLHGWGLLKYPSGALAAADWLERSMR